MRTDEFDYDLPREFIAQHPTAHRDASRLLVVHRKTGELEHRRFPDLVDYLRPGDLLVLNDTRVIPVRWIGHRRSGGKVDILLVRDLGGGKWEALMKSSRRLDPNEIIFFGDGDLQARYGEKTAEGLRLLEFPPGLDVLAAAERVGRAPLPPYIKRPAENDPDAEVDRERYQTVFAKQRGAIAAPTAGLHFTEALLDQIRRQGVDITTITLHVGLGTFRPVKAEQVQDHRMHAEEYALTEPAAAAIGAAGRVIAVGTTSCRVLETVADRGLHQQSGNSNLFIFPPYEFKLVDLLLTNFHLPRSTLLMLVCAFAGRELIFQAYEEAKREGYRFYSYGDAMLIL